jgi:replicative DNA helicase
VYKHTSDPDVKRIIENLDQFWLSTTDNTVDWMQFETWFIVKNPMIQSGKQALYHAIFVDLAGSIAVKKSLVETYLERYHAERIAFLAMEVAEGKKRDLADVRTEFETYMVTSGKIEELDNQANTEDLSAILDSVAPGSGLKWRLEAFNESLGDLRKANFCLFAARPEVGKTALMCSELTFMTPQLPSDKIALYFTNEEGARPLKARLYSSLLGVDLRTLESDRLLYHKEYTKALGGDPNRILIIDKHNLHVNDIEYWMGKTNAGIICIDQLRKVRGFDDMSGINRLERLFQQAREWSKEVAPVLTVSQLDNQAEGMQYPTMDMLYESKTAVQGECDVIVNIGAVPGSVPKYARWLNIVKNKMPTPGNPSLRHARHEVLLQPDIARYV